MTPGRPPSPDRVWYVGYGSNLSLARFGCYLRGGRPVGGSRTYPGCRDTSEPEQIAPVWVPGQIAFGGLSTVWGGGMALFDPTAADRTAGRAYVITTGQLADVQAQEMRRVPTTDLDLTGWTGAVDHVTGPGRYETLIALGERDGVPMVTLGNRQPDRHELNPPSAAYLRTIAAGLRDAHGWDATQIGNYLATRPGAAGTWTPESITTLVDTPDTDQAPVR